ncbi:fluoride efflux transporter CrcB [Tistrella sp. BH-R2-4]|jgi:CrcB protein|uniref:Fluoride-specific ion channel FluC n=1 Tax=Tistrella arctica TaxID=3133430 RepID=A0ABU9YQ81_9PROT|nr:MULTISPECIES: fluoride efflux transporter CrcB [Phyllobacteriaceae]MDN2565880.1 fluoride efflux transporter CrcB [Aquibium sp. A9E412]NRC54308.1 fluoride efflux transporter CrcB [Mesorhizobium sediminum]NRC57402.1 fluoride efflux transporter CrcB [Mesorhizobium sediminum]
MNYLIIFIGAGFGGMARHAINVTAQRLFIPGIFPFSTLFINVVGSCLMGVVVGYFAARTGLPQQARLFLTTGVLGGFTTFSAFSMETTMLIERGLWFLAGLYVFTSVALSLGALLGAIAITRHNLV